MTEIPDKVKAVIIEQNKQKWANTLYDAELGVKIAKKLEDKGMERRETERMKNALKAIDALEEILRGLPQETEATTEAQET